MTHIYLYLLVTWTLTKNNRFSYTELVTTLSLFSLSFSSFSHSSEVIPVSNSLELGENSRNSQKFNWPVLPSVHRFGPIRSINLEAILIVTFEWPCSTRQRLWTMRSKCNRNGGGNVVIILQHCWAWGTAHKRVQTQHIITSVQNK